MFPTVQRRFLALVLFVASAVVPVSAGEKYPFAALIAEAAERHGVDVDLLRAVISVESSFRPDAESPVGAQGLMQLMPGTQKDLAVSDPFDPRESIDAGAAYLRLLADEFGTVLALAAYNAGPGAVRSHRGIPPYPETRRYVRSVLLALIRLRAGFAPR